MRIAGWGAAAVLLLAAPGALAQNAKESCADASERGQKLVDARKLLEARNAFIYCAQESCPAAVRRDCQTQLDDVKKNIPSVVVRVKEKDGSDVAQGEVSLDGVKIGVLDGQDVELDPGTHAIGIALPDGRTFNRTIIIAPGEHGRAVTFDAGGVASAPPVVEPERPVARGGWSVVRTIGFIGMVVGGLAIVGGAVTQIIALVEQNNANTLLARASQGGTCDFGETAPTGDPTCDSALEDHASALAAQSLAIGLLVGGAVVTVAGVVMFVVGGNKPAPSALHVTPTVGPHFAGLSLSGSF